MTVKLIGTDSQAANAAGTTNFIHACRWAASASGVVTEIHVYVPANTSIKVGIWSDNAGVPGTLLGKRNTSTAVTGGQWNTLTLEASVNVTSGTDYWLGVLSSEDSKSLVYDAEVSRPMKYAIRLYTDGICAGGDVTWLDASGYYLSYSAYGTLAGWANIKNIRMGTGVVLATDVANIRMGSGSIAVADISDFNGVPV